MYTLFTNLGGATFTTHHASLEEARDRLEYMREVDCVSEWSISLDGKHVEDTWSVIEDAQRAEDEAAWDEAHGYR